MGAAAMNELKTTGAIHLGRRRYRGSAWRRRICSSRRHRQKAMFRGESNQEIAVVLDTNLTPELVEEGFVRELISKIQTMRKEAGFEVMDKITVSRKG